MPTVSSILTARSHASFFEPPWWTRTTSAIWSPTVNTGFSAVIGSWNTIAMRAPRISRIELLVERDEVLAVEMDLAAGLDAAGRANEAEQRERGDRLAAARLADEPDRLAGADLEADAVDRAGDTVLGVEVRAKVANAKERLSHSRDGVSAGRSRRGQRLRRLGPVRRVKLPRIEDVAQGVAEHIEGQHGDDDGDARGRTPPTSCRRRTSHAVDEDRTPARRRLARADAEVREPGLERDDVADGERRA